MKIALRLIACLLLPAATLGAFDARGAAAQERSQAMVKVGDSVAKTEAFVVACGRRMPAGDADNRKAFAEWKRRNQLQDFDRVMADAANRNPQVAQTLAELTNKYVGVILKQPDDKLQPICRQLPQQLRQTGNNTLAADHARELGVIAEMAKSGSGRSEPPASATAAAATPSPGAGVKTSQIEGLYYHQKSSIGMDGFGNPTASVDERIVLVLRDGSAYRYKWKFPPEDFNVAASKRDEPQAWSRWDGRSFGGIKASDYTKVLPLNAGQSLRRGYSKVRVGSGGAISDRAIQFAANGTFSSISTALLGGYTQGGGASTSGSVAAGGNVSIAGGADGRTSVGAKPSSSQAEGRYRLEGYAATFTTADGQVTRSLIGIPDYERPSDPDSVVYGGSLWFAGGRK